MLHEQEFTEWMLKQKYPLNTPRAYLRDIRALQERLSVAMEAVTIANTDTILNRIGNEGPARTDKQIKNDQSAVHCYHEYRLGLARPGYRRRGPRAKKSA